MKKSFMAVILSAFVLTMACHDTKNDQSNTTSSDTTASAAPPSPEWAKNATIYEVNTRQFSPEGNFKAVEAQLPRLKEMGVDILWLMPIYPVSQKNKKGSLGSPYAIADYKAINPD